MHAIVHKAINLPDADSSPLSGLSDPYVRLQVGAAVVSTSVADETLDPVSDIIVRGSGRKFTPNAPARGRRRSAQGESRNRKSSRYLLRGYIVITT